MLEQMEWVKPEEIEARSMAIIANEMPAGDWTPGELQVVKRCIHTSADFDYARNLWFSEGAVEKACKVLRQNPVIVTDTNMCAAGINKTALGKLGIAVRCFMADPDVAVEAKNRGVTRAVVSMERAAEISGPLILAVGNAPTALIRIYELVKEGRMKPSFLIAAPVGFVNVVEAKEQIMTLDVPCIVAKGRKGGSGIAAAICNALLYQVTE
ncbi:MAG: precorrin-8X methylmutase [Clostridiales bacterium]|nr:precorrin-8X methylmutase [Clostridiales bacterium]